MKDEQQGQANRLDLYREAARLSGALKTYCAGMLSEVRTLDAQELSECVDKYCGVLERLNAISSRIDRENRDAGTPEEQTECEALHRRIRTDLDDASAFAEPCREALQRQLAISKRELLLVQKKKKLAAYIRSPLIGQNAAHYDRRR